LANAKEKKLHTMTRKKSVLTVSPENKEKYQTKKKGGGGKREKGGGRERFRPKKGLQ